MPAPERCGTCRHWGDEKDAGRTFRKCMGVFSCKGVKGPDDEDYVEGHLDHWEPGEVAIVRAQKAYTVDGSGYYNALKCKEDFGCVLWDGVRDTPSVQFTDDEKALLYLLVDALPRSTRIHPNWVAMLEKIADKVSAEISHRPLSSKTQA